MRKSNMTAIPETSPLSVDNVIESLNERMLGIPFDNDEDEAVYTTGVFLHSPDELKLEMSDNTEFVVEIRQTK